MLGVYCGFIVSIVSYKAINIHDINFLNGNDKVKVENFLVLLNILFSDGFKLMNNEEYFPFSHTTHTHPSL